MIRIWLRRRWRARGHGIHSPFAYRMVTSVLRERGRYYGYEVLEKRCGEDVRWLKLVFRIVCALEPGSVGVRSLPGRLRLCVWLTAVRSLPVMALTQT